MSFVDSLKKGLFGGEDDYDDQYIDDGPQMVNNNSGLGVGMDDAEEEPVEGAQKKNKVVNIHATTQLKVVLVKPERFEDASTIADHLNNKRTVVLNLESTNKEVSRRLVDFLSGVAYANNGQIKRVANSTFIITRTTWTLWAICWTSWRTMARSIDPAPRAVRGFVPARTDEERFLMRHVEDLARAAEGRGIARYSGFLSDREQDLARAALNRADVPESDHHFAGGWPERAEAALPGAGGCYPASPLCCVKLTCRTLSGAVLPSHKDYLGSLMGLELRREALGDIVLPADTPGTAYVFALETAGELICRELLQVGRTEVTTTLLSLDEVPEFPQAERKTQTATVSSLRLDAVLAAMLHCSRGQACEWIAAGRVEINHLPAESAHAPVYEGDVFTVRGKGRFGLTALPGKSKKDRSIIEFFQY